MGNPPEKGQQTGFVCACGCKKSFQKVYGWVDNGRRAVGSKACQLAYDANRPPLGPEVHLAEQPTANQ